MSNIPETGRTSRVTIRLVVIQILVFSLLLTLAGRLWYLQIRQGDEFAAEAAGNHVQNVVQPAVRGAILDARGVPLADNETRLVVSADRTDLLRMPDDGEQVLGDLAELLEMEPEEVRNRVRLCDSETPQPCWNGSPYQPIPITDEATVQQALQIWERPERYPGIVAQPTAVRRYPAPYGANTAQVLGYLSPVTDEEVAESQKTDSPLQRYDQIGRSGLERTYDEFLRGGAGIDRLEVDKFGRVIGEAEGVEPEAGANLVTSIDARIQAVVEHELLQAMKKAREQRDDISGRNYEADSGAAIVMESHTGRIVAMASYPDYDPNVWVGGISAKEYERLTGEESNDPLLNRAIQGQSPAGSTFKVVTSSGAVRAGYDFDGSYECSSSYSIGNTTFKNFESRGYGPISLGKALEVSCNTVFYRLAHAEWQKDGGINPDEKPNDWLFNTAHGFGLGSRTGIDLPSEAAGRVPDREWKREYWETNKDTWCEMAEEDKDDFAHRYARESCEDGWRLRAGDAVNFSIGQGDLLVTPIQMASVYSAINNGGTLYRPVVGKAVVDVNGNVIDEIEPVENGKLPIEKGTVNDLQGALRDVIEVGTASWRFINWPQDEIPLSAKTGTATTEGKQSRSWLTTFSEDYTVVMTIDQAGTGSGASGPAVRNIYEAIYGVDEQGRIHPDKALLPEPPSELPQTDDNGTLLAEFDKAWEKHFASYKKEHEKDYEGAAIVPVDEADEADEADDADEAGDGSGDGTAGLAADTAGAQGDGGGEVLAAGGFEARRGRRGRRGRRRRRGGRRLRGRHGRTRRGHGRRPGRRRRRGPGGRRLRGRPPPRGHRRGRVTHA
ncbi:penicillin-binding protein 2 [Streptomyces sp. YIM 98790]|uniref:penicillin-binding protein 2 n=1 Tax=Streptomyces sp. YIM 98790 TaxID=2689077 RepID=UPI001408D31F|nr:penicillin-binding protein 2 [Streptomyces sp. YIM 98790]